MQSETRKAQASTLREWADQWQREPNSGSSEVSFLLRRAAQAIDKSVGIAPTEVLVEPVTEEGPQDNDLRAG